MKKCNGDELKSTNFPSRVVDSLRRQRNNETKKFTHSFLLGKKFGFLITKVRVLYKGVNGRRSGQIC